LDLAVGETADVYVYAYGDLPDYFSFYVEYPSGVEVEWGEWESDGDSCYLYVTGVSSCDNTIEVYLKDDYDNVIDVTSFYICVE
jgi:hypothetical protein